jgi:hypothetical protein
MRLPLDDCDERWQIQDSVVDWFVRGIAVLEPVESGGLGPPRGKSLERRRAWHT